MLKTLIKFVKNDLKIFKLARSLGLEVPSTDDPVGPKIFTSIHTTVLNKQFIIMASGTAVRRNSDKFRTVNVY